MAFPDLEVICNTTFKQVTMIAKDESNVVVNLTGWDVSGVVKRTPYSSLVKDLGLSISNPTAGTIIIPEMLQSVTLLLRVGVFRWWFTMTTPTGQALPIFDAAFSIFPQGHRANA